MQSSTLASPWTTSCAKASQLGRLHLFLHVAVDVDAIQYMAELRTQVAAHDLLHSSLGIKRVFRCQRSAEASSDTGIGLNKLNSLDPAVLQTIQHLDDILNPIHRHDILKQQPLALSPDSRPANALIGRHLEDLDFLFLHRL